MSSHGCGARAERIGIVIRQAWLALLAPVLLVVSAARAEAPAPDWIDWHATSAASSCADARAFESGLDRRLGDDAAKLARRVGLRLVLTIVPPSASAPLGAHWFGEILFVSERGEPFGKRTFDLAVSSCQGVVEALSLAATVYLKSAAVAPRAEAAIVTKPAPPAVSAPPLASQPGSPRAPALASLPAPAPVSPPAAPPPPARLPSPSPPPPPPPATARAATPDRPAARKPWALGAQGGLLVEIGDVPQGSRGFEVALHARPPGGPRVLLAASVLTDESVAGDAGVRVDVRLLSARLGLCILEASWTTRVLSVCPAFELGGLWVDGTGLTLPFQQRRWRFAADVGVALTQRLYGRWYAGVEGRVTAPIVRNRITFEDIDAGQTHQVFRASIVGAVAELAIGYMPNSQ